MKNFVDAKKIEKDGSADNIYLVIFNFSSWKEYFPNLLESL